MDAESFLDGTIRRGHPLRLDGEVVHFRSARVSPHSGGVLVVVVDCGDNMLAVEPAELSRLSPDGEVR